MNEAGREAMTLAILRGVQRHLLARGLASVQEFGLPNGRRADLFALTRTGEIWIIEVKSSIEDFRVDQKWPEYRGFCDRFYFASHAGVPEGIFPQGEGFILADAYDAAVIRESAIRPLAAATRKMLTIQMASLAASRLTILADPEARFAGGAI